MITKWHQLNPFIITGDSIIVWKQPDRIISAGMSMIRKDVRMSLQEHSQGGTAKNKLKLWNACTILSGINLQIRYLDMDDAGNYICEVENEAEPIKQTNTLQILGELRNWFFPSMEWIEKQ